MNDLQNFQDCTNENIERLKEKLEELNLNNNKVSFDEYTEEKPIKRRKKTKKKLYLQKMKKMKKMKNL